MYLLRSTLTAITLSILFLATAKAQVSRYFSPSDEIIFSWGNLALTNSYKLENPKAEITGHPVRFTCFLHAGRNYNIDLNKHLGFFSGLGLRNVGVITNEILPVVEGSTEYFDVKIVRRTYSLGVPLAIKAGMLEKESFFYAGGEIEWAFAYKEKFWESHNRKGTKHKYSEFTGNQVKPFLPSVMVGFQFKNGANLKFKYYLTDFLNHNYKGRSFGTKKVVSDLTRYKESRMLYIALSWPFDPKEITKKEEKSEFASFVK
ncbi:MAG: hypothetical protein JXB34_08740 [Bacteroidales bacterium]|nr:hypothetical protein [Bacteroidales bacterium]